MTRTGIIRESRSVRLNGHNLTYTAVTSPRRRTMSLTVSHSGDVRVYAPAWVSQYDVERMLKKKSAWIFRAIDAARVSVENSASAQAAGNNSYLFLGNWYPADVRQTDGRSARAAFDGAKFSIDIPRDALPSGDKKHVHSALENWYRQEAKEILGGRLLHYARVLGLDPHRIAIKGQKRIWGSCHSRNKSVNLNWKLVMAPPAVIDYVIVHELVHLKIPNHSRRFWDAVRRTIPDCQAHHRWLKAHASAMAF